MPIAAIPNELCSLYSTLHSMLDLAVQIELAAPAMVNKDLFPDERQHIAKAAHKRQSEFGTARLCARRALARLAIAPCALVPNSDRSPWWPPGIVGSISHTEGCCAVVLTNAPYILGLGLDIERAEVLMPEHESLVCTAAERRWLDHQDPRDRGRLGMLFFSAKEAFYKCQYSITGHYLDFLDVTIEIDLAQNIFSIVEIARDGEPRKLVAQIRGSFRETEAFVATTALLRS